MESIAEMAWELALKKSNSWTKADKRKYQRTIKKIFKAAEKGYTQLQLGWLLGDWSRVFSQLREDGFQGNFYDIYTIYWDKSEQPVLFAPKSGTGEVSYIEKGKKIE